MKYDFNTIDLHVAELHSVVNGMQSDVTNVNALKQKLLTDLTGAGAAGYEQIMAALDNKSQIYNDTLNKLRLAIDEAAKHMSHTDNAQHGKFNSIRV
ncbi:hypothetical protein F3087_40325 [Nocardia colli]|uniref:WXG100 family type VII secretion target n=1 Tax=Nocardia colli TaxID=2545717 RepID=A0A5N0E118_9NOCA|nr:hypothetical protein [Nocardia colli]KAA8881915.1 hypothetical protein F3087_40325 [Nocardia colli]